jgi:hypothetical protein
MDRRTIATPHENRAARVDRRRKRAIGEFSGSAFAQANPRVPSSTSRRRHLVPRRKTAILCPAGTPDTTPATGVLPNRLYIDGSAKVMMTSSEESVFSPPDEKRLRKFPIGHHAAHLGAPELEPAFAVEARGARSGSLRTSAKDGLQQVAQYYREFLKREGYDVTENSSPRRSRRDAFRMQGSRRQNARRHLRRIPRGD